MSIFPTLFKGVIVSS